MGTSSFIARKRIFVLGGILMSAAAMAADGQNMPDVLHSSSLCAPSGAAYVPDTDASGRPVAPADLADDSGIRMKVDGDMSPKIHSANPQLDGMRVTVHVEADDDSARQSPARCASTGQHR